jgi:hypothetical protein
MPNARFALALIAAAALLSGCGAHLYDAERDARAMEGKATYESAKLVEVVVTERANLQKQLDVELGVVARHIQLALQVEWFRLVDTSEPLQVSLMQKGIGRRLGDLGLLTAADAAPDDALIIAVATTRIPDADRKDDKAGEARTIIVTRFRVEPPRCADALKSSALPPELVKAAGDRRPGMEVLYKEYRDGCQQRTLMRLDAVKKGPLREAFDSWESAADSLSGLRRKQAEAQKRYAEAVAAYDNATQLAEAGRGGPSLVEQAKTLQGVLDDIEATAGALGVEITAGERIKRIDTLLVAAAGGTVDEAQLSEPGFKKAVMVAAATPPLADEARKIVADLRAPQVAALVIEKQQQEIRRDAARRQVERMIRRVELRRLKLEALLLEVQLLQLGRVAAVNAKRLGDPEDPFAKPLGAALETPKAGARRQLYQLLSHYVDSIVTARGRQEEIDYRLISLDHEEAVDSSETAVGLWNALIASPINQLAAYHGSGFRAEQLAALLVQVLTMGGIAVGVNR